MDWKSRAYFLIPVAAFGERSVSSLPTRYLCQAARAGLSGGHAINPFRCGIRVLLRSNGSGSVYKRVGYRPLDGQEQEETPGEIHAENRSVYQIFSAHGGGPRKRGGRGVVRVTSAIRHGRLFIGSMLAIRWDAGGLPTRARASQSESSSSRGQGVERRQGGAHFRMCAGGRLRVATKARGGQRERN